MANYSDCESSLVESVDSTLPQKAKDLTQFGIATIRSDANIYDAISLMVKKHITSLPVVDDLGLAGIISEKDVLGLVYEKEKIGGTVADYMTSSIVTFDGDSDLYSICNCLINRPFRSVIITHEGRLAGRINRADLIRANLQRFLDSDEMYKDLSQKQKIFTACDVMKAGLITVNPETPIVAAMQLLVKMHVTGLPVVDNEMRLKGVVTEKDVLRLLYDADAESQLGPVSDFMTPDVVTYAKDTSLFDIADCLINNSFRRVMIGENDKLIGIISRADIIAFILQHRTTIFRQKMSNN